MTKEDQTILEYVEDMIDIEDELDEEELSDGSEYIDFSDPSEVDLRNNAITKANEMIKELEHVGFVPDRNTLLTEALFDVLVDGFIFQKWEEEEARGQRWLRRIAEDHSHGNTD